MINLSSSFIARVIPQKENSSGVFKLHFKKINWLNFTKLEMYFYYYLFLLLLLFFLNCSTIFDLLRRGRIFQNLTTNDVIDVFSWWVASKDVTWYLCKFRLLRHDSCLKTTCFILSIRRCVDCFIIQSKFHVLLINCLTHNTPVYFELGKLSNNHGM